MKIYLVSFLILAAMPTIAAAEPRDSATVSISVNIETEIAVDGQRVLKAKLTNLGHESIVVPQYLLPWGNRYSITLLAIAGHAQPLPLLFPIDDPLPTQVVIRSGETIEGIIRFDMFFRDIETARKKVPLLLHWSYQLKTVDGRQSARITGSVQL